MVAFIRELTPQDIFEGAAIPEEAIVKVEWLDDHAALAEQELLVFTTTMGQVVALDEEFIGIANRRNALDDGDATLIPLERVLRIVAIELRSRREE